MDSKPNPKQLNEYSRWSGLTIKMIATILIFIFGGHRLDGYVQCQQPYFTIAAAVIATVISFYMLIHEAMRK